LTDHQAKHFRGKGNSSISVMTPALGASRWPKYAGKVTHLLVVFARGASQANLTRSYYSSKADYSLHFHLPKAIESRWDNGRLPGVSHHDTGLASDCQPQRGCHPWAKFRRCGH